MLSYRTDMAVECITEKSTEGVTVNVSKGRYGVERTDVAVLTDAEEAFGKPAGSYITIDAPRLSEHDAEVKRYVAKSVACALTQLMDCPKKPLCAAISSDKLLHTGKAVARKKDFSALVIGLGNRRMTSDSLGPKVVDNMIVTRHIYGDVEKEFGAKMSSLAAISTGVLGITGIETFDVVKGLVDKIKPTVVIVVDSLAARRTQRIATSFQLTDTGIVPGGGIANHRYRLDASTLGVPVIAIGVPLVVYASTLSLDLLHEAEERGGLEGVVDVDAMTSSVLTSALGDLVVTPKDVDAIVKDTAYVVALAVNLAVHKGLTVDDVEDCLA